MARCTCLYLRARVLMLPLMHVRLRTTLQMNAEDLTEEGMRQGVFDSEIFCLFLTRSVLSRTFCLKEITWYECVCACVLRHHCMRMCAAAS